MRIWVAVITWVQRRKHFNQDTFPSTFVLVRVISVLMKSSNSNQVRKNRKVNKLKVKPERIKKNVLIVFCWLQNLVLTLSRVGETRPYKIRVQLTSLESSWAATELHTFNPDKKKKGENPRWELLHQEPWELWIEAVSLHGGIATALVLGRGREAQFQCFFLGFLFCFRVCPVRDCPIFSPKKGP